MAGRRLTVAHRRRSCAHLSASLIDQAERFLPELVTSARLNGHTWHDIAQALATSPDEARLRFDPDSPVADGRWPYGT